MNFSSVLIVTYGRTGSTLLQGLLNSIEGCLIRGENYNFCYGLFEAYRSIVNTKQQFGQGDASLEVTFPWYGAKLFDDNKFIEDARNLVLNQLNPNNIPVSCIGFKEIRYHHFKHDDELYSYLNFLNQLFPNPAFVVLSRDHDQVAQSAWWKEQDAEKVKVKLERFEIRLQKHSKNKDNFFSICYNDIIEKNHKLAELFEFLGAEYDEHKVASVLATKHSFSKETKDANVKTIEVALVDQEDNTTQ
jgi:hypothetical protein